MHLKSNSLNEVTDGFLPGLLIVDDEANILKALKRSFLRTKYNVFTAESAAKGLEILNNEDIQVVLSDFRMPKMSGGQFVKQLKESHPDVVSMIISGYADFDSAIEVLNSGAAFKFLRKPWCNKGLLEDVDAAFDEYFARKTVISNEPEQQGMELSKKAIFEHGLNTLLEANAKVAVASIRIFNLAVIIQQLDEYSSSKLHAIIEQTIKAEMPSSSEVYQVELDQIFVLIPDLQSECSFQNVLSKLNEMLNSQLTGDFSKYKLNSSIAYAISPFDGVNGQELMQNLHSIFAQEVFYKQHIQKLDSTKIETRKRQLTIQSSIAGAINENQFELYFQPKVNVDSGATKQGEVLMRWEHQELGWVSPSEFINLSELDGQIEQIGTWLIDKSVKKLAELSRIHNCLESLSINISARQLSNHKVVDQFAFLIDKYKLDPALIEIEITESSVMEDLDQTNAVLWQLKLLGLRIAIDDFGTGYSSFAYLSKLPVDVLKLDKVLVDDLVKSDDVKSMLRSLIALCHQMQIKVVAEGVEDEQQLAILQEMHCDYIQGYVYSKAVRLQEFEKILINQPFKNKVIS